MTIHTFLSLFITKQPGNTTNMYTHTPLIAKVTWPIECDSVHLEPFGEMVLSI